MAYPRRTRVVGLLDGATGWPEIGGKAGQRLIVESNLIARNSLYGRRITRTIFYTVDRIRSEGQE